MNDQELRRLQRQFFRRAKKHMELTRTKFSVFAGCPLGVIKRLFPYERWVTLQEEWLRRCLRRAMLKVYRKCIVRKQFTVKRIIKIVGGVTHHKFNLVIGGEWLALRAELPTDQEKVLATLEEKVKANVPVAELTRDRVIKDSGISAQHGPWLSKPLRAAQRLLASRQQVEMQAPPAQGDYIAVHGGWVRPGDDEWDLRFAKGHILRRNKIRPDIADAAWSVLEEELRAGELACSTISHHHNGFVLAGKCLGQEVLDVRAASLEGVQRAWHKYEGAPSHRYHIKHALLRLFSHLTSAAGRDSGIDGGEMLRIASWLAVFAVVRQDKSDGNYLSADEMDAVISGCLRDIQDGVAFVEATADWESLPTTSTHKENASAVLRWGDALMILVKAVTGLRRQSVAEIEVGDWAEIYSGVYALAWHHGKEGHEDVVAISALIIDLLQHYVDCTAGVRASLGTRRVFLTGNTSGNWYVYKHITSVSSRLHDFAKRHHIEREGEPIKLNSMLMRRTYATRELYEGRSLHVLRRQLGHLREETTERYVQFDRFEHPTYVRRPLDKYGRVALSTWRNPVLLEELSGEERLEILADKGARDQEVGLCSQDSCVKAQAGGPPPCSLCEYLVTGPEFLNEWKVEHHQRTKELETLTANDSHGHLVAEKQYQLRRFKANYQYIIQRSGG